MVWDREKEEAKLEAQLAEKAYREQTGDIDGRVLRYDSKTGFLHVEEAHGESCDAIFNVNDGEVEYGTKSWGDRVMERMTGKDNSSRFR